MTDIVVPSLGESVTEATVAKWFKKAGDAVKADEPLCELETDKVTLEVFATTSGVIGEIKAKEGDTVSVGAIIGVIAEGAVASAAVGSANAAEVVVEQVKPAAVAAAGGGSSSASVFPLAPSVRKMTEENNINPSNISGTGKDGRITKGDVINFVENKPASSGTQQVGNQEREERVKMSALRRKIAERLKQSQNTAAILSTFNEIDMSNLKEIREQYKDHFEKKHGVRLGFMSFYVKAVTQALKDVPIINASIDGDTLVYKKYYDIGVAVGTEQGLVVPILRDADKMSIADIERSIGEMAKKARDGKLTMNDLTGGSFTISNGGVYGSLMSTPIINPPQSGILGMHKVEDRPVAINGKVEIRPMMYVTLSYDHRLIDGRDSVTFLVKVKEYCEDPRRLLLG